MRGRVECESRRVDGQSAIFGDLPSVVQRHAVMVQTAQDTAEIAMLQFVDKVINSRTTFVWYIVEKSQSRGFAPTF